jgi:hypothetical protein
MITVTVNIESAGTPTKNVGRMGGWGRSLDFYI